MRWFFYIAVVALISSCKKSEVQGDARLGEWLVPKEDILNGGPGIDGIPALLNPTFVAPGATGTAYLRPDDLVIGYVNGNDARAYPHKILDWHEIVNDDVSGDLISVIYCPLTGTGVIWNRNILGTTTTFGVSGLLYQSNLLPYDRLTGSNWSQLTMQSINGRLIGTTATTVMPVETTWETWQEMYPNTRVISSNTGYDRDYESYPYRNYKEGDFLLYPVHHLDERLFIKERVHGILTGGKSKTYRLPSFQGGNTVIHDEVEGELMVVVGNESKNFVTSFHRNLPDQTQLTFTAVQDSLPIVMKDQEGTYWNVFGYGVSGPRAGERLPVTQSFMGYWFSWGAFYPVPEIY